MKSVIRSGAVIVSALVLSSPASLSLAHSQYPPLDLLLSTQETVIGQKIAYPAGQAQLTSAIVTLQPGQETGLHSHNVPLYGYVLEGELELDYGQHGKRTLRAGEAIVEAVETNHSGRALGQRPTRVLVLFMGAEGVENTVELEHEPHLGRR